MALPPGRGGGIAKGRRAGKDGRDGEGLRFSSGRAASFPQARQEGGGGIVGRRGNAKGRAQYRITTHNNGGKISGVCFAVGYITDYHATVQRCNVRARVVCYLFVVRSR